ncbi:MAG: hypothetical protein ACREF4_13960 [Gammaproteobacteria bacterium]
MPTTPDLRGALAEVADALQVASLLATRLRRDLGEHAQNAIKLEAAVSRAVRALRRLQPKGRKR